MCYEDGKPRYLIKNKPKGFQPTPPLIRDKKFTDTR